MTALVALDHDDDPVSTSTPSTSIRTAPGRCSPALLRIDEDMIKRDLGSVLMRCEQVTEDLITQALEPAVRTRGAVRRGAPRRWSCCATPALLDRMLQAFDACGIVGEATNKLTGYLAATSRFLDEPLAVIVQSSSAAGQEARSPSDISTTPARSTRIRCPLGIQNTAALETPQGGIQRIEPPRRGEIRRLRARRRSEGFGQAGWEALQAGGQVLHAAGSCIGSPIECRDNVWAFGRAVKDDPVGFVSAVANSMIQGTIERLAEGKFSEAAGHAVFSLTGFAAIKAAKGATAGAAGGLGAADDLVDLASASRRSHILNLHRAGAGVGKSEFPGSWSDDFIMHQISDIATDPSLRWIQQTGRPGQISPGLVIQYATASLARGMG